MVELTVRTARRGGITLIGGVLDDHATPSGVDAYRVRLTVSVDGSVWKPPRDDRTRWVDGELETILPAGSTRGVGLAGRGTPATPPLAIASVEPAETHDRPTTPVDILRVLGDPRPPQAAVPAPDVQTPSLTALSAAPSQSSSDDSGSLPAHLGTWLDELAPRAQDGRLTADERTQLTRLRDRATELLESTPGDRS